MMYYSLTMWTITSVATFTHAFTPSNCAAIVCPRPRHGVFLYSQNNNSPGETGRGDEYNDDENDSLLDELRNTKKDLFGTDITHTQELQDAAQNSENAFLAAMLEQTQQFQQIKSNEGSEKAIDTFMGRIQEEDEADKERVEQQIKDENEEEDRLEEINEANNNTWQ